MSAGQRTGDFSIQLSTDKSMCVRQVLTARESPERIKGYNASAYAGAIILSVPTS